MSDSSKTDMILVEATQILAANPAHTPDPEPEHVRAALRRCRAAWQRAYKAELDRTNGNNGDDVFATYFGERAYRKAMPILSTHESIQAYIACAAHGLLVGAINPKESGQILHAAQVALGVLNFGPQTRKLATS